MMFRTRLNYCSYCYALISMETGLEVTVAECMQFIVPMIMDKKGSGEECQESEGKSCCRNRDVSPSLWFPGTVPNKGFVL